MRFPNVPIFRIRFALPLVALLTSAFLLSGCLAPADRESDPGAAEVPAALSRDEGFKVLESMGYARAKIVAAGTDFIVEGDMVFRSEDLARMRGAPLAKTAQRATMAVRFPKPNLLKVAIHSSMADWAKFVHQAVNHWNSPNTRLHLQLVPFTSSPDITIHSDVSTSCPAGMQNLPDEVGGRGYVGSNGFPGSTICVNKDATGFANLDVRVGLITHELGHTIGFQHTDQNLGVEVPGSPTIDNASIMKEWLNTHNALSTGDIQALEVLYNSDKPLGGSGLDGDRKDDIAYWRPSNGLWSYLRSATNFTSSASSAFGKRGNWPMADMDIDGDGIDDRVVWHTGPGTQASGYWRAILSSTGVLREIFMGTIGDIPIGNHDMDGDGKDDLVVWRWNTGTFYVLTSRSDFTTPLSYDWGGIGDIPVGGIDADRDGKDDFIYWRGTNRLFWVRYSASNFTTSAPYFMGGQVGDIPMGSTDLDRDSWDDLTVWRPESGNWHALTSGSGFNSGTTQQWGMRGDVPVIGTDIDQDGRKDIVVWRPSDATWYIKKSSANFTTWTSFIWGQ